jgi:hypothetical protein
MTKLGQLKASCVEPTCGVCKGAARRSSLPIEAARRARCRDAVGRLIGIRRHVRRPWHGGCARERLRHIQCKILSQTFELGDANGYYNRAGYVEKAMALNRLRKARKSIRAATSNDAINPVGSHLPQCRRRRRRGAKTTKHQYASVNQHQGRKKPHPSSTSPEV